MKQLRATPITDEARAILTAPPLLEQLNRDRMFREVGIVWTAIRKRGKRIEGVANGRTVIWDNAGDVLKFSRSEAVVADALGVVLPKPTQGRPTQAALGWRRIAALILQIAKKTASISAMRLQSTWRSCSSTRTRRPGFRAPTIQRASSKSSAISETIAATRTAKPRRLACSSSTAESTSISRRCVCGAPRRPAATSACPSARSASRCWRAVLLTTATSGRGSAEHATNSLSGAARLLLSVMTASKSSKRKIKYDFPPHEWPECARNR